MTQQTPPQDQPKPTDQPPFKLTHDQVEGMDEMLSHWEMLMHRTGGEARG